MLSIKPGHKVIHCERGDSIIGSATFGIGHTIKDPHARLLILNELFDGTHTTDYIESALCAALDVTPEKAKAFIRDLINTGHCEERTCATTLTDEEKIRYSRSLDYFGWISTKKSLSPWSPQEKLKNSRVCILGAGGVGGVVAAHLAMSGIGMIRLVDYDTVELSNLNRQFLFNEKSIGKLKVEAACESLRSLNSSCSLEAINQRISSEKDIKEFVADVDIFYRCADEYAIPYWASDAALTTGVPWIDCSYDGPIITCCCLYRREQDAIAVSENLLLTL